MSCYLLWKQDNTVVLENHLIEWMQAAVLALAAILSAIRVRMARTTLDRLVRFAMILFAISLMLREIDIDDLGDIRYWHAIELGIRLSLTAVWVGFGLVSWKHRTLLFRGAPHIILSGFGVFTALGCLLYASSWPFDKFEPVIAGLHPMLVEETLQLNATIMFALSAFTRSFRPVAADPDLR